MITAATTGGRRYSNYDMVSEWLTLLNTLYGLAWVAHGGATGADHLTGAWCREHEVFEINCRARWKQLGRSAGSERNKRMLETFTPYYLIAFPGGTGTQNCVRHATHMGIRVIHANDFPDDDEFLFPR